MATSNSTSNSTNANGVDPTELSPNYGNLDLTEIKTKHWLVRIPNKLALAWESAKEGDFLGELTFTKGGPPPIKTKRPPKTVKGGVIKGYLPPNSRLKSSTTVKQSLTVSVPSSFRDSDLPSNDNDNSNGRKRKNSDLPLEYTAEAMTKKVPVLHPFIRNDDGSVSIIGSVSRTCNLQVARGQEYRKLCRNRMIESVTPNRFVRPVDISELSMRGATAGAGAGEGFGDAVQKHGKSLLEAQEHADLDGDLKKKFEGQSSRSVVFELFSGQRFWTVKELRQASGRLEKELRPVLAELCEFHRSGEQKGTWELKKSFKCKMLLSLGI